jgi:hypothetical protein
MTLKMLACAAARAVSRVRTVVYTPRAQPTPATRFLTSPVAERTRVAPSAGQLGSASSASLCHSSASVPHSALSRAQVAVSLFWRHISARQSNSAARSGIFASQNDVEGAQHPVTLAGGEALKRLNQREESVPQKQRPRGGGDHSEDQECRRKNPSEEFRHLRTHASFGVLQAQNGPSGP